MTNSCTRFFYLLLLPLCVFISGCVDDDDPEIPNEEEVITDVMLTLTPTNGGEIVFLNFQDRDGDGGNDPIKSQTGNFVPNQTYDATLTLTNATDPTDIESITTEVMDEALDHQVFYVPSAGLNLSFTYADMDTDGNGLGIVTDAITGPSSNGTLTITLRHEPNKTGATIENPAGAGGETDVEVEFNITF